MLTDSRIQAARFNYLWGRQWWRQAGFLPALVEAALKRRLPPQLAGPTIEKP